MLREHGMKTFRNGMKCKARIKYLEDDYKKVKEYHNKSGKDNISDNFDYFEEIDAVLGCRPRIIPWPIMESGFDQQVEQDEGEGEEDDEFNQPLVCSTPELWNELAYADLPSTSCSQKPQELSDEKLAEAESLFFTKKPKSNAKTTKKSPAPKRKTPNLAKKAKDVHHESTHSDDSLLKFLAESQQKDHNFFKQMAATESERELRSQKMMMDMFKEVAKIFIGNENWTNLTFQIFFCFCFVNYTVIELFLLSQFGSKVYI